MKVRPTILTIAGFDPSAGAGLTADIKVFEANSCYGMAVQTANTIQTEDQFLVPNWVDEKIIIEQLSVLMDRYEFAAIKIGLVPSFDLLHSFLVQIRAKKILGPIIWDPILATSTRFDFQHDQSKLSEILQLIDWITPNWNEVKRLANTADALEAAKVFSHSCKVYLKGGHNEMDRGKDYLIEDGKVIGFNPKPGIYFEKHGSGCVFSSALASNLALGHPKTKAILRTKRYTEQFLKSNTSQLGYHKR